MFNRSVKLDRILTQCIHAIEQSGWTIEQCLDRFPRERDELEPLLRTAMRLRKARQMRPSVEFRSKAQPRFHSKLKASRRSLALGGRKQQPSTGSILEDLSTLFLNLGSFQYSAPLLLIMLVLIVTGGGVAYAADNAKPGDILYSVDKGIEQIRFQFEKNAQDLVRLSLQIADERLDEVTQLIDAGETEEIVPVIEEYKELIVAAAPLIVEAHIAGENVQPLIKETNEAIAVQEQKLEDMIERVPNEVEEVIKLALKDVEEIRFFVVAPLPTHTPEYGSLPIEDTSPTAVPPSGTSTPLLPPPPSKPTSTSTLIPPYEPTDTMVPYASPTPPFGSETPTSTLDPRDTNTPTGTLTISPTPTSTHTPTPTRTPTGTPTPTRTPTETSDGSATEPPAPY